MGGISSKPCLGGGALAAQDTAEYLIGEFIGDKSFPLASDYWKKLLELPIDLQWTSTRVIEACRLFATNNCRTRHLAKILIHLAWCLQECVSTSDVTSSAFFKALNALSLSSVFLKYVIEKSKSDEFGELYLSLLEEEPLPNNMPKDQNIMNLIMHSMLNFIAEVDVSNGTYLVHYELLNFMLVASSTQLLSGPSPGPSDIHPFLDWTMAQDNSLVNAVVRKLLFIYITRPRFPYRYYDIFSGGHQRGVLKRVGSAAANLMLLPFNYLGSPNDQVPRSPLAEGSLNILLILTNHQKCSSLDYGKDRGNDSSTDSLHQQEPYFENPFRKALENVRDTEFDRNDIQGIAHSGSSVRLPFASLFDALGMCVADEASVLLLYSLVHGNSDFLEYVLVRTDLDTLLMPMLETLYNAPKRTSNHIYMVLVIFLILSQDSSFNASIHKMTLPNISWYQERLIHQTSLGSLIVIILIRTVKYNLFKRKDIYLHTNCLATLANMAPHVHQLSAYASQQLVSLFDLLSRKYNKLAEIRNHKMQMEDGDRVDSLHEDSQSAELHIYTDFLRLVLEIINAILTYALPHNPEVVYAIMHRQEIFFPFRNHPRFYELFDNIYTVLDFFNRRMDAQNSNGELSVEKVLQIIINTCRSWRGEGVKMYTQLRFAYEQESNPEEFFIAYVWQLVLSRSDFTFNPGSINLFPVPLEAIGAEDELKEFEKLENGDAKEHTLEGESLV